MCLLTKRTGLWILTGMNTLVHTFHCYIYIAALYCEVMISWQLCCCTIKCREGSSEKLKTARDGTFLVRPTKNTKVPHHVYTVDIK